MNIHWLVELTSISWEWSLWLDFKIETFLLITLFEFWLTKDNPLPLFLLGKEVLSNDEKSAILLGITRDSLIKICTDLNIKVHIGNLSLENLYNADEAFFSGTASEVTPICSVDDNMIGNGTPGSLTIKLQDIYMDIVRGNNDSYAHWLTMI